MDQTRFSVEVSTKGTHSIFSMNIPRQFADLNSRVFLEVDQVVDQDASAIAAGFCQMQDKIICLFANLANIHPAGQFDVLPFPCEQNPTLIHFCFRDTNFYQVGGRQMVTTTTSISLFCVAVCFKQRTYFATETTAGVLE
jgi:hypothetical protein